MFPLSVARGADDNAEQFEEARIHWQRGRVDEALEVYESLAKKDAEPARVAIGRSRCFESRGDWKQATDILERAAKDAAGDAQLLARLAEVYLAHGRYDDTARTVARALKIDANLPLARLVEADLNTAVGKLKQADDGYHWFVKFYNQNQPEDAETLLLVARGASQYARWHSVPQIFDFVVNTLCTDALAKDKECWQSHFIAGMLLLEKYNRGQAIPELKKALAINPQAAEAHAGLAFASLQDHSLADAALHVARAVEINSRLPLVLVALADVKLEDDDVLGALKPLEQALAVNPHDEEVLGRVAACRILLDGPPAKAEIDELFAHLDKIEETDGKVSSRVGELVVSVARRNPRPGKFLYTVGTELEARKKFDLAERFYKQAIVSMPQLSGPKSALGMLYMRVGRIDEAQRLLDQALEADPYHIRVSNMRKVLKLLDGYETIATEHFLIRVDSQADLVLGRYMAEFLEEHYSALVKQFGYEPPEKTQFEIYNKSKGLSAHQWFSARMVGLPWVQTIGASTGMIVALASPTAADKPFNWAKVLKHEFVHILTLQETNFNIPHWYTEALAVLSEESPRPEIWNQLLLERVPKGDLMNLDTLNHGFSRPKTPLDWQMAYCQSRLYAEYMLDKFGRDSTAKLLAAYRDNLSTDEAIPKVFGVEKAVFEQGYRDYLETIVSQLRGRRLEETVTPAEAEKAWRDHPDDTRVASRYAHELFKLGKRKEARKIALAALEKKKGEPLAAVVMAGLELRSEDVPAAIGWLEAALDKNDPHPQVLELLADLRLKQTEYDAAAALYELGLKHDPDHVPWLKGLATAYLKTFEYEKLKPVLERLVVADGDNPAVRKKLAQMALENEEFAEAVRYARLALYIDVMDVETHQILARGHAGLKHFDKSVEEWGMALRLKPEAGDVEIELARAEAAAGRKEAARSRLDKLLEREPDNEAAQKLRDELE
ncbi:MAG: tetratricopeptide repeat protein [Deltaproteobacteria bacterium]